MKTPAPNSLPGGREPVAQVPAPPHLPGTCMLLAWRSADFLSLEKWLPVGAPGQGAPLPVVQVTGRTPCCCQPSQALQGLGT